MKRSMTEDALQVCLRFFDCVNITNSWKYSPRPDIATVQKTRVPTLISGPTTS